MSLSGTEGAAIVRVLVGDGSPVELGTPGLILDVELPHRRHVRQRGAPRTSTASSTCSRARPPSAPTALRATRAQIALFGAGDTLSVEATRRRDAVPAHGRQAIRRSAGAGRAPSSPPTRARARALHPGGSTAVAAAGGLRDAPAAMAAELERARGLAGAGRRWPSPLRRLAGRARRRPPPVAAAAAAAASPPPPRAAGWPPGLRRRPCGRPAAGQRLASGGGRRRRRWRPGRRPQLRAHELLELSSGMSRAVVAWSTATLPGSAALSKPT